MRIHRQTGVTLLETMLAIAIAASMVVMGIRLYGFLKRDSDYQALRYNADILFAGARNYYLAQCGRSWDASTGPIAPSTSGVGALDPGGGASTGSPIPISKAVIDSYVKGSYTNSPLIDNSDPTKTFIVQFKAYSQNRNTFVMTAPNMVVNSAIGKSYVWEIQVAIKLKSNVNSNAALNYTQASCIAQVTSGVIQPCSSARVPGSDYLVWKQMPGFASSREVVSNYWAMSPLLVQFKQMYNTYPIGILTDQNGSAATKQYYLCGN